MLGLAAFSPAGMTLAHPVTQHPYFPVPPLVAAAWAAMLVLVAAVAWPERDDPASGRPQPVVGSWAGPLAPPQVAARVVAVAVLALAIATGRLGVNDELENLAPALVVGVAWPLLVLINVSVGPAWRWCDPWDGLARAFGREEPGTAPTHVWPAVVVAIPWVWYLSAYPDPLGPRPVGVALALYTLFTVAGCLAVGRVRWLASAEPLGIVLSWMALLPRGRLADWRPPAGAEALLGVLAGGVLFGAARRSALWGGLGTYPGALAIASLGVLASCLAVACLLMVMGRAARRPGGRPVIARAAVPALAGIVIAVALDSNRLLTSVQLLPGLVGDPFGWGWDLLGPAGAGLNPAPLGTAGLLWLQLGVLLAGHLVGAAVLGARLAREARGPGAAAVSILVAASAIAVATH
ncbi:MAG: hypothetical protein ACRDPK_13680 [Carbonactinosporaceae bacterium]